MSRPSPLQMALVHMGLVLATVAVLYPVLWVLKMALEPSQGFSMGLSPIPSAVTLDNFRDVIFAEDVRGRLFFRQALNSVVVSVTTAVVGVSLAATAAYGISRWDFPGKSQALGAFLVTQMFPGVVGWMYLLPGRCLEISANAQTPMDDPGCTGFFIQL